MWLVTWFSSHIGLTFSVKSFVAFGTFHSPCEQLKGSLHVFLRPLSHCWGLWNRFHSVLLWSIFANETAKPDCFQLPYCLSAQLSLHQDTFSFFVFDAYVFCLLTINVRVQKLHLEAADFLNFPTFAPYVQIDRPFIAVFYSILKNFPYVITFAPELK